jgi:hypothetical protein
MKKKKNSYKSSEKTKEKINKEYFPRKRQPFQQMMLGKVAICLQKTETRSMPVILYYCQLNVD